MREKVDRIIVVLVEFETKILTPFFYISDFVYSNEGQSDLYIYLHNFQRINSKDIYLNAKCIFISHKNNTLRHFVFDLTILFEYKVVH